MPFPPQGGAAQAATTSFKGTVELATDGETVTGTSDAVVTTPGNVTAKMAAPGAIGGTTPNTGAFTVLQGGLDVITAGGHTELSADQCRGSLVLVTGNYQITLPAVSGVVEGGHVTIYSTTAVVVYVDPNASDRIILDGTALTDGYELDSPGGAGNFVTLVKDSSAGWTVVGKSGVWADGGVS